uniref:LHX9-like protein n=1 Tax=Hofstenia miamia TaxID=442651 RepID=A0A5P8I4P0_HOFMI|nr:LHX9-like protein [Hofstenia miamia]
MYDMTPQFQTGVQQLSFPDEKPSLTCGGCHLPILDKFYLLVSNCNWHLQCLRCSDCRCSLDDQTSCFIRDGSVFCKEDYFRRFFKQMCACCNSCISPKDMVMRARHHVYHTTCFACSQCHKILQTGDQFGMKNSRLYCRTHYDMVSPPPPNVPQNGNMPPPLTYQSDQITPPSGQFPQAGSPYGTMSSFVQNDAYPPSLQFTGEATTGRQQGKPQKGRPRKNKKHRSEDPFQSLYPDQQVDQLGLYMAAVGAAADHQQHQRNKRVRTSFKNHQLRVLKQYFQLNHNPDAKELKQLSQKTGLSKRVLQVWFQNARAKYRRNVLKNQNSTGIDGKILSPIDIENNENAISAKDEESDEDDLDKLDMSPEDESLVSDFGEFSPDISDSSASPIACTDLSLRIKHEEVAY